MSPLSFIPITVAALTVMLWLLWSDSLRRRKSARIVYIIRVVLYLVVGGVIATRLVTTPALFSQGGRVLATVTVGVALVGAGYFVRKAAAAQR